LKHTLAIAVCWLILSYNSFAQPVANFTSDIQSGCSPIVVNFKDQSVGNPTSWLWDFGNGATSTRQNPSTTYFQSGAYNITLTATNASGSNTVTKTSFIAVYDQPLPDFKVDKTSGCFPVIVQFSDMSATPLNTKISAWKWDFGDGGSSTVQNPQYTYRNPGNYTVTLSISNDKGCSRVITKPNMIDVATGVVPGISYVDPSVCSAPATVNFTSTSTGPGTLTYNWNFGNGSTSTAQNPSSLYSRNGTYTVSLNVISSSGCSDSTAVSVIIGKVNTDFTIPSAICPKTRVQFLNNSNPRPIRSSWQFSNGFTDTTRNTFARFDTAGTYTVTLTNTYTVCTDVLTKTFTVLPSPGINFTASDTGKCNIPFAVNFTTSTTAVSYLWDFGDSTSSTQSNTSHTYTKFGDYTVFLVATGSNGCSDTLRKPAYIKIRKPIISFPSLPTGGCIPYTFNFIPKIQTVDTVTSYKWDFGDGVGTSTLNKPNYTYTNQGTYAVKLTITTKGGCTETFTLDQAVKVGTKPVPDFKSNVTTACANPGVSFTNLSTNATTFNWELSDGSSSTMKDPTIIFSDTGWIDVKLIADNNGCKDSISKLRYIFIQPSVSKFNYQPDCNNKLQYTFTDRSIGALSWDWNFGDGTTYTGPNPPVHTFPANGTYNVSLATTNGACSYVGNRTITIADYTPDFTASVREGCKPFTATLFPSAPNAPAIKNYIWDFGDGNPIDFGQGSYGQFTYTAAGSYNITLTTIDTFGCKNVITKNAYVRVNGPVANFTSVSNSGCKGLNVFFTDTTITDGINPIVKWQWDFGDSTVKTYTAPPFQHVYDSVGDYDVKLVVTDKKGCMDSISIREFVKISSIKADWTTTGATCPNAALSFSNQSTSDLPFTYLWNFGDSQTSSTNLSPSHAYIDTGFYTVSLKIRDILGCEDSLVKKNIVQVGLPKASFTANSYTTYCTPFNAQFTNTSYFYQSSNWDLSNGTSGQQNPSLYYTTTGVYPIKLTVTSAGGCQDSISDTLHVFNPTDGFIRYTPLNGCIPLKVSLDAFSQFKASFVWDFGDGNVIDTTISKIEHTYTDFGDFVPKIILREPSGTCVVPITGSEVINLIGVRANYALDKNFFCDSGIVSVKDSTTFNDPIVEYKWDFGDGTKYSTQNPVHQYLSPGLYNVSLVVNTQRGCTDTLQKGPIKIVQSPLISVNTDTVICVNDRLIHQGILNRPDTSTLRWSWNLPNGNRPQVQNPSIQQYKTAGTFKMTTIATNSSGCADTVVKSLLVNPLPIITVPPVISKFVGVPVGFPATYSSNVVSYSWSPPATLDCNDCPQPVSTTKFNTKYTITVIDSNGCKNTSFVDVIVTCKGADIFLPNTFSPNDDGSNDVFYARGKGLDRVKSLRIFNRWGEVVFEKRDFAVNDASVGWDGKYKGNKAQPDVYVYQVEIFCENGEIVTFSGNVALIQ